MRPIRRYGLQESEKQMKIQEIKDYAMPIMIAEKALKDAYQATLENDYQKALAAGMIALNAVHDMMDIFEELK